VRSGTRVAWWVSLAAAVLAVGTAVAVLLAAEHERDLTTPPAAASPVVMAAGDISCAPDSRAFRGGLGTPSACRARFTSDLALQARPTAVLTLGDNQYGSGSLAEYSAAFDRNWGRLRHILHPVPGDQEYEKSEGYAQAYFAYFGLAAGQPLKGYYSFNLGSWHIVALNTNIARGPGSVQERWLRADLARNRSRCTLAYMHRPRFSSGGNGGSVSAIPLWQALFDHRADVVLAGDDHHYERFRPQTPDGTPSDQGIRQFVVGTGGASHGGLGVPAANSEVLDNRTFGLLRLDLHDGSYDWRFVPEPGGRFTDAGHETCNRKQRNQQTA
jgi:hypothetical protein